MVNKMKNTTTNFKNYAGEFLCDLPGEILDEILDNNYSLREKVSNMTYDWANDDVREMLDYFDDLGRGIDYEIGSWGYSYIKVSEDYFCDFLADFIEAQEAQCFCGDEATETAKKLLERARYLAEHYWTISEKNEAQLTEWIAEGIEGLTDEMLKYCRNCYDYAGTDEAIKDCFSNWWIETYGDEYLVDEEGNVYRRIPACREYI